MSGKGTASPTPREKAAGGKSSKKKRLSWSAGETTQRMNSLEERAGGPTSARKLKEAP